MPGYADPIAAKQAEAQHVLGEINQLDQNLGKAVEAYDASTLKLQHIRKELSDNQFQMKVAKSNLKVAEARLGARLRALYQSSDTDPTLTVLMGAKNLDDIINRLDTANRLSAQDAQVFKSVTLYRHQVAVHGALLVRAHRAQERVVADRAAAKAQIQSGIADRQRLLSSIKGEIATLKAQQAAQQAILAQQARARLVQQQAQAQARLNQTVVGATVQAPTTTTTSGDPSTITTVAPPSQYGGVVGVAMGQLGKPYVYGTAGPDTFDCSGLVVYAYAAMGVSLPHSSYALWNEGVYVSRDQLQPGDLVFFDGLGHVGIYIGGGQFIHAPHTGTVVQIASLDGWYSSNYVGARRIL
ncbi:MAG TPA: NlpC/P60 family protein [Gaiellaceae bacterium]|nr:NlpC/P60 family protein [Gaiellaceae bacterium]